MRRLKENPLITPEDVVPSRPDYEVVGAFNAGATRFHEDVILLVRVAERPRERSKEFAVAPIWNAERREMDLFSVSRDDPDFNGEDERVFRYRGDFYLTSISHLRIARSNDGIHFRVDEQPAMFPERETESYGLEDPRITKIGDEYWITYKAVSRHGITTALASTTDFVEFRRYGIIFCPENLDVVIFPHKFEESYVAWTRPVGRHLGYPSIWAGRSPDLVHWGVHEPVVTPRPGMWDSARVGSSTVPFLTPEGWIEIYHGADERHCYCVGVALIKHDDPTKIIARSTEPLMRPEECYECEGFFGNVVFPCGAIVDGESVMVYYGAADCCICAAEITIPEILAHLTC